MDFLLEPNVAYLLLLSGVMVSMLAIASPGTGMLEAAAFFMLALSGYTVYHLAFHWWALVMLVLSVVPFIYAIQKSNRELYLLLALALLVTGSVFLFATEDGRPAVNPILASVASVLVTGFLWIAIRKSVQAAHARPTHDLDTLVGKTGESRTKIHAEGSAQVAGELWSARSEEPIPTGSPIIVVRREGFVLVVERDNSSDTK